MTEQPENSDSGMGYGDVALAFAGLLLGLALLAMASDVIRTMIRERSGSENDPVPAGDPDE